VGTQSSASPAAATAPQRGRFLQSQARRADAAGRSVAPFPLHFFSEDAEEMAALPDYGKALSQQQVNAARGCHNQCTWQCGPHKECDQACEPVCLPPECRTSCTRSTKSCETRCAAPHCAVICPHSNCSHGGCGKCGTLCNPPVCTTQCAEHCESFCDKPRCSWRCQTGACPQPKCQLVCLDLQPCALVLPPAKRLTDPGVLADQDLIAEANASLNPKVLSQPMTAPSPWAMKAHMSSTLQPQPGEPPVPVTPVTTPGPVQRLKARWAAEDALWRG